MDTAEAQEDALTPPGSLEWQIQILLLETRDYTGIFTCIVEGYK